MGVEHDIQKDIVLKLIHKPEASFNELWDKNGESNKFAYHISKLEKENIIQKKENGLYSLTDEGRKLSAFIEGDTGGKAEFPTLVVVLLVKKDGKLLCQKRLKEPFYGVWGFVSGKINFGQNLFECAKRDLEEETGLISDKWKMKAIEQTKAFDGEKLLFHHYMIFAETDLVSGELKEKTHKAEHKWMTLEDYRDSDRFPGEWFFTHIFNSKRPVMVEARREMKDGKIESARLISCVEL